MARRSAISALYYGRSVDSWVLRPRPFYWLITSLEEPVGPDGEVISVNEQLWRSRRGMPLSPVEDVALTRVVLAELMAKLTTRHGLVQPGCSGGCSTANRMIGYADQCNPRT